jgi:hypothetical protein
VKQIVFTPETGSGGPLAGICAEPSNIPSHCVRKCSSPDTGSGWYTSATLTCGNPLPEQVSHGLWDVTCGVYKEGLLAGQDEGGSHVFVITTTPPSSSGTTVDIALSIKGDIFILPYVIDKVWGEGQFYFSKNKSDSSTSYTGANFDLECKADSKIVVDMAKVECQTFSQNYYRKAGCS